MADNKIRKATLTDLTLLVLLAIIWASAFLVIKIVVPDTGPFWLATIRVSIAFVVLLPIALMKGLIWPKNTREWKLVILIMLFNVVIPFFLISWAELHIDAGVASLLMGIGPFMAIIGSHFTTDDDRLNVYKLLGVVLGFSGVALLVGNEAFLGLGDNLLGQTAALTGAMSYVVSGLLVRRLSGFPPLRLSTLILGMSALTLSIVSLFFVGLPVHSFSTKSWVGLVYLGLFPTALGYIFRYYLVQTIGVSAFAAGLNLVPVFGVMLSAYFLNEIISTHLFVSLILILSGLFVLRFGQAKY